MKNKRHDRNKFVRMVTLPIRVLRKARDFYVRSMTECGPRMTYGDAVGLGYPGVLVLPRSFSAASSRPNEDDNFRELVRAASVGHLASRIDVDMILRQHGVTQSRGVGSNVLPRSSSVGMGRIDEDTTCDFGGACAPAVPGSLYPRSGSCAVGKIAF